MTVLENALAVNDGKAVVISIKREWLSKIMAGEKTLEVRKSRPWEISFPFAVFCYETKANGRRYRKRSCRQRVSRKRSCEEIGEGESVAAS